MAVTDLTGTTWVFNDTPSAGNYDFFINFIAGNTPYSGLYLQSRGVIRKLLYGDSLAWMYGSGWSLEKTITITGGEFVTNASLISYLESNAKQQVASYPKINSFTYHGKQINHINGKPIRYVHYKGKTYEMVYKPILPKLATPQNLSADGTTITFDAVENATSYEILADGVSIGEVSK